MPPSPADRDAGPPAGNTSAVRHDADIHAGLRVVRRAPRWVVVSKPAGLLSVPGKGPSGADCVAARVAALVPGAEGPLIVHRLDMETSGLMVLALDAQAHRALSRQFEERRPGKAYEALAAPAFTPTPHSPAADPLAAGAGEIDLPIRPDVDDRPRQIVDHAHGRPSRTRWRVLDRRPDAVRLELEPVTGRTHQLRLHCLHGLGRAIVGDSLYGAARGARLMLHARELSFDDPVTGERIAVSDPAPF